LRVCCYIYRFRTLFPGHVDACGGVWMIMQKSRCLYLGLAVSAFFIAGSALAGSTFDKVKEQGYVQCGVGGDLPGFSNVDDDGNWSGIDVDVCHAIAAAMFDDADKVRFTPLTTKERLTALQSGEIDVLSRNASWTLTRDAKLGLNFTGTTFYDGQGFMVKKDLGVDSIDELDGAAVCVLSGTTTEMNLADYFRSHGMDYTPVTYDKAESTSRAFDKCRCDVLTSDRSQLSSLRLELQDPDSAKVLPELISKEPLGPAVRHGDDEWFDLVKWTLFAMKNAEFLGVNSDNVDDMRDSDNPAVQRLLGSGGHDDMGKHLG